MNFMFFTRTDWNEPPRLRHQLANLLVAQGHSVTFFQKPKYRLPAEEPVVSSSLQFRRYRQLVNHQLKFISPARWVDDVYLRGKIKSLTKEDSPDVIVNFNYDYHFLSNLFPGVPLIHIVNDDFVAGAIPLNRKSAWRLQERTAQDAGRTLCVSYMLLDQLRTATPASGLFLPWARSPYTQPPSGKVRDEVLSWGYINDRYDFDTAEQLLDSGMKINFFGSVTHSERTKKMLGHQNATYHGVADLKDISEVLARCSCSLLAYNANDDVVRCITISNRGFELLSFGLPLLYTELPGLIKAPEGVIYRCSEVEDYRRAYRDACDRFDSLQPGIQAFLEDHSPERRYEQFMQVVESLHS
ncbi:MAG: glycosyltransferase [Gammaproteobacteria bacterium]